MEYATAPKRLGNQGNKNQNVLCCDDSYTDDYDTICQEILSADVSMHMHKADGTYGTYLASGST